MGLFYEKMRRRRNLRLRISNFHCTVRPQAAQITIDKSVKAYREGKRQPKGETQNGKQEVRRGYSNDATWKTGGDPVNTINLLKGWGIRYHQSDCNSDIISDDTWPGIMAYKAKDIFHQIVESIESLYAGHSCTLKVYLLEGGPDGYVLKNNVDKEERDKDKDKDKREKKKKKKTDKVKSKNIGEYKKENRKKKRKEAATEKTRTLTKKEKQTARIGVAGT